MKTNPFKPPYSTTTKLIFFTVLLFLSLVAYTIINEKINSGAMATTVPDFVDLSVCDYEELDDNRIKLTVPGEYAANATQESLTKTAEDLGYESITLNENGSVTYLITKAQHEEMLTNLRTGINQALNAMIGSKDYSKIASIEPNDDYTYIKVTLNSKDINYNSSMSMIQFKTYHLLFNAFNATPDNQLKVDYFNADGKLILTAGSDEEK